MVRRHKPEEFAGALEFQGRTEEDEVFKAWMAEHRAGKGGKIRVGLGATGVRVMFHKDADLTLWKERHEGASRIKKAAGS